MILRTIPAARPAFVLQVLSNHTLMNKIFSSLWLPLFFLPVLLLTSPCQAQSGHKEMKKQAAQWYSSQEWLKGLPLKPHASIDQEAFARQYQANQAGWDQAFAYMKETDLNSLPPGRHPIAGEQVYVLVTEAAAKDLNQTRWESHRLYNDIHYVVKGKEKIGLAPVASSQLATAYDLAKDIAFYTAEGKFHLAQPGTFFIVTPGDAHRPGIKVDGDEEVVKKIVIKISTRAENSEK
jgi:biofilm protein TabA